MSQDSVFTPAYGKAVSVTPTTTSASSEVGKGYRQLVISNTGAVNCYVKPAIGTATATNKDYLVLANTQVTITKDIEADYVNYISASGTGALHIMPGNGF